LGRTLIFSGRPHEGLTSVETSIRLDPRAPLLAVRLNEMAIGHYYCRNYEATINAAKRAIRAYPEHALVYRWLAAAQAQKGRITEAKDALDKAIALAPTSFDMYVRSRVPWHRPEDHTHMVEGLRKAGWEG
jgi:adenylate cyclase